MATTTSGSSVSEDDLNVSIELKVQPVSETPHKKTYKEHVFWLKDIKDLAHVNIVSLPHPRSGQPARYVLNINTKDVYEIQRCRHVPSSYFISDSRVQEDGSLYITTPIDPMFLMLLRLEKCKKSRSSADDGVFVPDYQIYEEDTPETPHNLKLIRENPKLNLELICDTKSLGENIFYRLSEKKLLNWLRHKVDAIGAFLPTSTIDLMSLVRAQASGYRSTKDEKLSNTQLINISIGLLSEYISQKWVNTLKESYGDLEPNIKITKQVKANFSEDEGLYDDARYGSVTEKRKREELEKEEKASPAKKPRIKAHEKIDTRKISKITSFFTLKK